MTVGEAIRWLSIQGTICDNDFVSMTVGEEIRCLEHSGYSM